VAHPTHPLDLPLPEEVVAVEPGADEPPSMLAECSSA
jgi:hypothetical protein